MNCKGALKIVYMSTRWRALPGETEVLGVCNPFSRWFKYFTSPSRVDSLSRNRASGIPPSLYYNFYLIAEQLSILFTVAQKLV